MNMQKNVTLKTLRFYVYEKHISMLKNKRGGEDFGQNIR